MSTGRKITIFFLVILLLLASWAWYWVSGFMVQQEHAAAMAEESKVAQIVVMQDMPAGTVISTAVVGIRKFPPAYAHSRGIAPEDFETIEGKVLKTPLRHGEQVFPEILSAPPRSKNGQRKPPLTASPPAIVTAPPLVELKPEPAEKTGRTVWDLLNGALNSPLLIASIVFIFSAFVWLVHRLAKPGGEIVVFWGLMKYHKKGAMEGTPSPPHLRGGGDPPT